MSPEHLEPNLNAKNIITRSVAALVTGFVAVKERLKSADLNPHEGRLRASAMPVEYMNIPDFPPVQYDLDKQD